MVWAAWIYPTLVSKPWSEKSASSWCGHSVQASIPLATLQRSPSTAGRMVTPMSTTRCGIRSGWRVARLRAKSRVSRTGELPSPTQMQGPMPTRIPQLIRHTGRWGRLPRGEKLQRNPCDFQCAVFHLRVKDPLDGTLVAFSVPRAAAHMLGHVYERECSETSRERIQFLRLKLYKGSRCCGF